MNKLRVMTIVGTRPEIIKMSEIIKKCDRYFDHTLVHTGQNYDYALNEVFFKELGLRAPDLYLGVAGEHLGETIGNVIQKSYEAMLAYKPEAVLVLGDTNSCLSVISAKRLKIPVFHMEAGNRCFDENLPEEVNRRIVDTVSDVNLCYTEHARRYLYQTEVKKDFIYVVGSPMTEVLTRNLPKIKDSSILNDLELSAGQYILLSAHREENIDIEENFLSLMNSVNQIAVHYGMPVVYGMHPRSRKAAEKHGIKFNSLVNCREPFGFFDYNQLQLNAFCVLSDSGTLAEDASFFRFPAVSIRTSTERPEALDKAVFTLGGIKSEQLIQAIDLADEMRRNGEECAGVPDYQDVCVSSKVVKIIQSYTGIVNRKIWGKL